MSKTKHHIQSMNTPTSNERPASASQRYTVRPQRNDTRFNSKYNRICSVHINDNQYNVFDT